MDLPELELISGEEFLEAEDTQYELVDLSGIAGYEGKQVRVRSLKGFERDQYDQSVTVQEGGGKVSVNMLNARAKIAALTCVDAEGNRLFTDKQAVELGKKNAQVLALIFDVAARLSGMAEDSEEEAKEVFGEGPVDGPSSAPQPSSTVPSPSF